MRTEEERADENTKNIFKKTIQTKEVNNLAEKI